jgi:spermidine/putrescine transport system permease protein
MTARRARLLAWLHRYPRIESLVLLLPAGTWLAVFFVIPLAIMATYAFRPRHLLGGVYPGWTTVHVARLIEPLYLVVLERSVILSLLATLLALLFSYPIASVIVRATRWRGLLLFLVVLPFWTSFLVRTYATIFLLRDTGPINQLLLYAGVIREPFRMLYTPGAVLFGLVTGFVPFMVLPIYASLEKVDPALLEAAEALGATEWRRFLRVTWPLTLPGVAAGSLLVFVPALGSFLTSDLLGGAKVELIGNLVQNQFTSARNWPFGSALSFLLLIVVLLGMLARTRVGRAAGST